MMRTTRSYRLRPTPRTTGTMLCPKEFIEQAGVRPLTVEMDFVGGEALSIPTWGLSALPGPKSDTSECRILFVAFVASRPPRRCRRRDLAAANSDSWGFLMTHQEHPVGTGGFLVIF